MSPDPTTRFSARVENYRRYRPSYPPEMLAFLERECGLTPAARIADIGCGTGLLAQVLLRFGCEVFGVEPNAEMRAAAEEALAAETRFHSIAGRAEATTLPDAAFDVVTAGQAFHWFDPAGARREFARILKPNGWLVLVWNERAAGGGFQAAYETVVKDCAAERTRIEEDAIDLVFGHHDWRLVEFPNRQVMNMESLQGRLASSSYAPLPDTPEYDRLVRELNHIFAKHEQDGSVTLLYDTKVYAGRLTARNDTPYRSA